MRELGVCAPLVVTQLEVMASQADSRLTRVQDTTLRYRVRGRRLATLGRGEVPRGSHPRLPPAHLDQARCPELGRGQGEAGGSRGGKACGLQSSRFTPPPGCHFGKEVLPLRGRLQGTHLEF